MVVKCDGRDVWHGDTGLVTVGMIDDLAESMDWGDHDPAEPMNRLRSLDHRWTIRFHAPLSDETHERVGRNEWKLIDTGMGFA